MFLSIDREDVVADPLASVFFQNYDETVDKQWLGQLGEFGTLIDNHAFLFVNHVPCQVNNINVGHTAAVKAEEEKVETKLLLLGEEAAVHELYPADDVRIDGFGLELSPRHLFRSCLEDCGVGSVHVEFVLGVVYQCTEDAKELAQAGTITVFDAAPLQIDDVFQKKFLGNVGEVKARQVFVVLPLGEGRKRSAELLVHTGGADTLKEFAVLEFFVVLEVFDSDVDELENRQHFQFLLCLFLFFGFEAIGPLQYGEVTPFLFPPFGNGHVLLFEFKQQLVFLEVFAGSGFKTQGFIVPAFVSSGDTDDPGNAGVTGLVENHFQFDHLGVLGVFATFECDRTIHIVNFLVVHVFLPVPYMGAYIRIELSTVFGWKRRQSVTRRIN